MPLAVVSEIENTTPDDQSQDKVVRVSSVMTDSNGNPIWAFPVTQ